MNRAAFKATYSDMKLIKGRKVVQFVFEVPIESSSEAMDVLGGVPDPSKEVWCAIARLDMTAVQERASARMSLPQRIGALCADKNFQRFCGATDEDGAAEYVRRFCGVTSRSQIVSGSEAERPWRRLDARYRAWLNPSIGAA